MSDIIVQGRLAKLFVVPKMARIKHEILFCIRYFIKFIRFYAVSIFDDHNLSRRDNLLSDSIINYDVGLILLGIFLKIC